MCAHPRYPRPARLSNPGYATVLSTEEDLLVETSSVVFCLHALEHLSPLVSFLAVLQKGSGPRSDPPAKETGASYPLPGKPLYMLQVEGLQCFLHITHPLAQR